MIRLAILTTSYPRTPSDDAGIFVQRLVNSFTHQGNRGVVIVPHDSHEPRTEQQDLFTIRRFRYGLFHKGALAFGAGIMPNLRRNPFLAFQIPLLTLRFISEVFRFNSHVDIVHANWVYCALPAWIARRIAKIPYVVTLRGEDMKLLRSTLLRGIFRPSLTNAHAVVTVSEQAFEEYKNFGDLSTTNLHHIPNGVTIPTVLLSSEEIEKKYHVAPQKKMLLAVGTVIPRKRIEILIDALRHPALTEYELYVAGRTSDSEYCSQLNHHCATLGVTKRVRFLGAVSPSDIFSLLQRTNFFLSASSFEGRPNAVLEALASGCVCIVSDIPQHKEIIEEGKTGLLFSSDSPSTIGDQIQEMLGNPEHAARIAQQAKACVGSLTWSACAERYLKLLEPLASRNSSKGTPPMEPR